MYTIDQVSAEKIILSGTLQQTDVFAFVQQITLKPWSTTSHIEIDLSGFHAADGIAMLALIKVIDTYQQKTLSLTLRQPDSAILRQLQTSGMLDGHDGISVIADEPTPAESELENA